MYAPELVNATPPYAVRGGVRQILTQSSGDVLVANRADAASACAMFEELEGIDIEPAAAVAVACLRKAVVSGRIPAEAHVLLNITGGGRQRMQRSSGGWRHTAEVWSVSLDNSPKDLALKILDALGVQERPSEIADAPGAPQSDRENAATLLPGPLNYPRRSTA